MHFLYKKSKKNNSKIILSVFEFTFEFYKLFLTTKSIEFISFYKNQWFNFE